jgi:hypothetical protein
LQLRSSARLFWPVAYTAVIAGLVILCRKLPARWPWALVLVFAALQFIETQPMRSEVRRAIRERSGYTIDTALFRSLLASHSMMYVWPQFACGADVRMPEFSQLYLLASEVAIPVNMTYTGRLVHQPNCDLPELPIRVQAKDLWVFVPLWNSGMVASVADWRSICRQSGVLVVCAQDLRNRTDLTVPNLPVVSAGETLATKADARGAQALASGWYPAEPWGAWARGTDAYLVPNLDRSSERGLTLKVSAVGIAAPPATTQRVTVLANGRAIATWDVRADAAEYDAVIPPLSRDQPLIIDFHIDHPVRPQQHHGGEDARELGFGLSSFRFDAQ